jgi:hypothetical protein
MKKSLLAGVAVLGLSVFASFSYSAEDAKPEKITGVLIDQSCGAKQMSKDDPEAAAAKHPAACAKKCADSGYAIITGKKMLKLDDAGAQKAKDYLAKSNVTKVTVEGTKEGDTLKITSIEAAK